LFLFYRIKEAKIIKNKAGTFGS
jgi:hypothetical protein